MKHSIRSLRPLLIAAFALAMFPALALAQHYQQTNLVSNVPVTPAVLALLSPEWFIPLSDQ
jgi:hypothetical protein